MGIFDFFSKSKKETLDPVQKETLDQGLEKTKQTFFSKITRLLVGKSRVDQGVLDDLEELLITADVGVETTLKIIDRIENRVSKDRVINSEELNQILRDEIIGLLEENAANFEGKLNKMDYCAARRRKVMAEKEMGHHSWQQPLKKAGGISDDLLTNLEEKYGNQGKKKKKTMSRAL